MARRTSNGKCAFCKISLSKGRMVKHLESCRERLIAEGPAKRKAFHLLVEGRYQPVYWMHLEVPLKATLKDLDVFLRDMWLECCNHLSCFIIEERRYESHPERGERGMNIPLDSILTPGMKFYHEYDYGTTTYLVLKVISERDGEIVDKRPIKLLARNDPPPITCESCGKMATQVCTQCIFEGGGWLCDECAQIHECGEEMLSPVVNSPRVGMCGYVG